MTRRPPSHRRAATIAMTAVAAAAVASAAGIAVGDRRSGPRRAPAPRARAAVPVPPPTAGRVQIAAVAADDAPGGRKVWIYRPGVKDSPSLPVVYFLHGLPGSYLDLGSLDVKAELDRLITTRLLPPLVLAVPDGNSTRATDTEWADSANGSVQLERFVTGPLRRLVEGANPRARSSRFITGYSMGGYGAMNIALHHPDLYSAVAAIAGYFDTDDESNIFDGDPHLLVTNRPDRHLAQARQLRIMLADGTDDVEPVTQGETQRFATALRATGVTPYVDLQPGSHSPAFLQSELPRALSFLVQGRV